MSGRCHGDSTVRGTHPEVNCLSSLPDVDALPYENPKTEQVSDTMPLWFWIAFAAGCAQTARNALARSMVGEISPPLNSWSRFTFMLPLLFPMVTFFVMR